MAKANQADGKRYLYGKADEKFVKEVARTAKKPLLAAYKFRANAHVQGKTDVREFNKADVPIVFKCSPDTLINLCVTVLDAVPLPKVYDWDIEDVCQWLRENDFKQYQNTFRVNLVTGRNLLLLDAAALAAMNIRDFVHIKQLTQAIRDLYNYEMPKFGRCLALHNEFPNNLYKLERLKTGAKYHLRRSEVWRQLQLIRPPAPNYTHWQVLEQRLADGQLAQFKELIGGLCRFQLYACKAVPPKASAANKHMCEHCSCMPPCECYSAERNLRRPWLLKCLPHLKPAEKFIAACAKCVPPCNCRWPAKSYKIHGVLSCLKSSFPYKYDCNFGLLPERKSDQICFAFLPKI